MEHNIAINRAIAIRSGRGEQKLLHARTRTVWRRGEVCVVRSRAILRFRSNGVVSGSAAAEVVYLEVARCLRKTKIVREVVHDVVVVEKIRHHSSLLCSWIHRSGERKGEILRSRRSMAV